MAKLLTKGELLNRLGIASPQTLTTLLQEMEDEGIEVPSEGAYPGDWAARVYRNIDSFAFEEGAPGFQSAAP